MKAIYFYINEIGSIISAVRAWTKLRDEFEAVIWELVASGAVHQALNLPTYNAETRWYSIFHTFHQAYNTDKAFQAAAKSIDDRKKH